jgi:hypothetical protein
MRKIAAYILTVISAVIIPLSVTGAILLTLAVNENFYISVIKKLDLVETFIETKNLQLEKDIKKEIEKKTGMSQFRIEYEKLRKDFEEKSAAFTKLNKTDEYNRLDKQIDELDDLKWEKSSDDFKTEDDFNRFKKQKMLDLKNALKEIKEYRKKNDDVIDKAENEMEKAKDKFEDADDILKDKESEAKGIISKRRGDFMNEMYHDIARIEPALTQSLNTLFIEQELRRLIRQYLSFFTSWKQQVKAGNIYEERLNVESGMVENTKKVILPPLSLSFRVKVNDNGIIKDKNLLSEVFVETIRETPGLKSPWVMTKIFGLADSFIAEMIANTFLKGTGFSMNDGVIKSETIVLSGDRAKKVEKVMMLLSFAKYSIFTAAGISVFLMLLIIAVSPEKKTGLRLTGHVMKYPSILIASGGIAVIISSLKPGLVLPQIVNDPVNSAFIDKIYFAAAYHFFVPITAVFLLCFVTGTLLLKFVKKN